MLLTVVSQSTCISLVAGSTFYLFAISDRFQVQKFHIVSALAKICQRLVDFTFEETEQIASFIFSIIFSLHSSTFCRSKILVVYD